MSYLFFHKMIRNDEHCPLCRRYYVSFHTTLNEVYDNAILNIEDINKEDSINLKNGNSIWIDEWVRRRNGDLYKIMKIQPNIILNLNDNLDNTMDSKIECNNTNFMVLQITVNKLVDCPNNIIFKISFHNNIEEAFTTILKIIIDIDDDNYNYYYDDDDDNNINNKINLGDDDIAQLKNLKPIWKNSDLTNKKKGYHFQIIDINKSKSVFLNEECPQIQQNIW
jgi:hypothetical protein